MRRISKSLGISGGWCLLAALVLCAKPGLVDILDWKIYDLKLRLFSDSRVSEHIVHVDVDDAAIEAMGPWPWDREKSSRIVQRLDELGAKTVAFDIIYSTPGNPQGDESLFRAVAQSGRVIVPFGPIRIDAPTPQDNPRNYHAAELAGEIVTPSIAEANDRPTSGDSAEALLTFLDRSDPTADADRARIEALYHRSWIVQSPRCINLFQIAELRNSGLPALPLIQSAQGIGHIKATPDSDGVYRRVPLMVKLVDRVIPSLSLAALAAALGANQRHVKLSPNGSIELPHPSGILSVPVDSSGNLLIRWSDSWDSFKHYSALDLLSDEPDADRIGRYQGKIVVLGVGWTGSTDMGMNSLEKEFLLSRLHSGAMDTMLTGRFLQRWEPVPFLVVGAAVLSLAFLLMSVKWNIGKQLVVCLAVLIVSVGLSLVAFRCFSIEVPLVQSFLVFVPSAVCLMVGRAVSEERERKRIQNIFGRYVSEEVVEEILKWPQGINLEGELRQVTFLVSDLRGFTPLTESHSPLVVVEVANRYFERMTEIIFQHGGTINEIMGDGLLVFFGAPRPLEDHPSRAVACALAMQKAMAGLNEVNKREGLPELAMGIGINTGVVVLGSIGSEKRGKYTGYGSAINVAFRVEGHTSAGEVLVTEAVYRGLGADVCVAGTREVKLKGIEARMTLYSIIGTLWPDRGDRT